MLRSLWSLSYAGRRAAAAPAGLIVNPGAEAGGMTGWTNDIGGPVTAINTVGSGYPGARSGSYYFSPGNVASAVFSQTISIPSSYHSDIDAGLLAAEFIAYQAGYAGSPPFDSGSLILECIDSGTTVLASHTPVTLTVGVSSTYFIRKAKIAIPANTRKIRVGTTSTRGDGTSLDTYWDDFDLILTSFKTLFSNSGGTGNRTGSITVTATNITAGGGTPSDLINGSLADSYWWTNATGNGTAYLTFDFGSARTIDAFRWYQDNTGIDQGTWRFEGSNDNSSWTQIDSDFTLTAKTRDEGCIQYFTNATAYRYYRLRHMSGSRSQTPYLREIEFRIL